MRFVEKNNGKAHNTTFLGNARVKGPFVDARGTVDLETAGAGTLTAAGIAAGWIVRDCAGGNRADTTATAALIIEAMALEEDDRFSWILENASEAAETSTVYGGTGVTITDGSDGNDIAVAQFYRCRFECMVTGAATIDMTPFLSAA